MESTSEGKERMDALSTMTPVVVMVVVLSSLCFFRVFLFISFAIFEFGINCPFLMTHRDARAIHCC